MSRERFILYLSIGIITATACNSPQETSYTDNVNIVLEKAFGSTDPQEDSFLYEIRSIVLDSSDNVYVHTGTSNAEKVISFSADGSMRWIINTRGKAPGELYGVCGLALGGNTIFVGNQGCRRIDRFSLDGVYIDSSYPSGLGSGFIIVTDYLDPNMLVTTRSVAGEFGTKIIVSSVEETIIAKDTFSIIQTGNNKVEPDVAFPPVVSSIGDNIVVGHVTQYSYSWYTTGGEIVRTISRPEIQFTPPLSRKAGMGTATKRFSHMYPLVQAGDYYIGGAEWPQKIDLGLYLSRMDIGKKKPDYNLLYALDIFDVNSGNLIASIDSNKRGIKRVLASDSKGRLYAELVGNEQSLGRFEIDVTMTSSH